MAGLMGKYAAFLTRRPVLGNMISSAVLFATGDVIAQQLIEKKGADHDLPRTARIVTWGGLLFAPTVNLWFRTLERIPIRSRWPATFARVGLDQFGFAPVILSGFFTAMTFMEGNDFNAAKLKWHESFFPTLQANWMLFIPFQMLNMGLVPLQYRLLAVNAVNIPWNAFLSLQNAKGKEAEESAIAISKKE
ncbi:protein SYM1 [Cryptococcus neoformans C23]|uniref:Protein SYM1 n=2 Tax=Cryptococcus neoformans TaxID=5207 RepID=A0A854QM11_CRYNE|nr:protein SYM1 [Cryptococcus neoformans var. grubii H99]AUB22315.1 protein SYM1 [Cryptococcus neoformans var. grubii]OWZ36624.1 protein SYM1 [Cryptococcus neoformans var. grubii AD2-60a]OWZ48294.1 protein SYM1 [Cryptococcus neoformans var. grubii C23]OWZ56002.1 protein SYM1 [Cryptococcus neoformans var. grubii AD1-83a]OWZ58063.1 protein SYM1 [Cryptococcus neoformans var. grubii 125.91]OWZ80887.1 protein SYM1 [Cryptococcus neoformans var. grubii Bt85]OXC86923.1 protein SYM1 [Cryptococcus neo|eukprot:XP_012046403.1 protein SYM1 [Cryptococcus neoformans var. grubii H99]